MPTKPSNQSLNANSPEILNAIRNEAGGNFAEDVPAVVAEGAELPSGRAATAADSLDSLRAYGAAVMSYESHQNEFLNTLVNVISRVLIRSRLYKNPWAPFKQGYLELGEQIEEIFVKLAHSQNYDPEVAEQEVFKRVLPDVATAFHRVNFKRFYKITIERDDLRAAFVAWTGVTDLISRIIESVYTSANLDEFIMMKYLIANAVLGGRMATYQVDAPSLENANMVMARLKALSDNLSYMDTQYNYAGVPTYSDKRYQFFIFNTAMSSNIDVGALSRAFNLDKVELMGNVIGVNRFDFSNLELVRLRELLDKAPTDEIFSIAELASLGTINAVVVDRNWFMIFDQLDDMRQQDNQQGLYWNYFYHIWRVYSTSPFANAVAVSSTASAITAVAITPAAVTSPAGSAVQFTANVTKTGLAMGSVAWIIDGQNSSGTTISANGLLTISQHETAKTITVTAASMEDPTKSASATVTVGAAA